MIQEWIRGELEVSHIDLRNAGAVVRASTLAEAVEEFRKYPLEVVHGEGFVRVPGSAKIPIRNSIAQCTEEIRRVSGAFARRLSDSCHPADDV